MKRLAITQEMQSRINAAAGTEVDPNSVAAFECIAMTNRPVKKPGSLFDGSTFDAAFFGEMSAYLLSGKSVPLAIMHNDSVLPTGRVFNAKETDEGLRSQFYIPADQTDIVKNVDNGVIGYVSTGTLAQHLLCSECGWDYRGKDASILNILDQTCANDHTIGQDGVHIVAKGLDTWFELSLCGTGASPGAAILSRSKAQLANTNPELLGVLAANGGVPEAVMLVTSPTPTGESDMDVKEFTAQLTASATEIAQLKASVSAKDTEIASLKASLATANTTLDAANTAKTTAEAAVTTLTAENTALKPAAEFLKDQTQKALTAMESSDSLPTELSGMIEIINKSGKHLAQLVAGQSAESVNAVKKVTSTPSASAFKTRP